MRQVIHNKVTRPGPISRTAPTDVLTGGLITTKPQVIRCHSTGENGIPVPLGTAKPPAAAVVRYNLR